MIRSLSDLLVVADIDGTLLTHDQKLLASNLETIRLFTLLGGRFTLATGRLPHSIANYPELVECIQPAITCGGCVLYDFAQGKPLQSRLLPRLTAQMALDDVMKAFPRVGAVVVGGDMRVYLARPSRQAQNLFNDEDLTYFVRPVDEIPPGWNKLLFAAPEEKLAEVAQFVSGRIYPGAYFLSTNKIYYELMPQDVSKGSGLKELCAHLDVPLEKTIVIGDYYNDIEMMKEAGYSVAMGNAPNEVRMQADEITGTNEEGGVGAYLYKLIKEYGQ